MESVNVFGDNVYARNAIISLLRQDLKEVKGDSLCILVYEKLWISDEDLLFIMQGGINHIYVICHPHLNKYLTSLHLPSRVKFVSFGDSLENISHSFKMFMRHKYSEPLNKANPHEGKALSLSEKVITTLYVQGLSIPGIAVKLNKSIKTVSAHKRSAMKKLGVASNMEFFTNGRLILMAEQQKAGLFVH